MLRLLWKGEERSADARGVLHVYSSRRKCVLSHQTSTIRQASPSERSRWLGPYNPSCQPYEPSECVRAMKSNSHGQLQ